MAEYKDLYRYSTGECFYLAHVDLTKQFSLDTDGWAHLPWSERPRSRIIYTDWEEEAVHYADSSSQHQVVSIKNYSPIVDADAKRLLELPFSGKDDYSLRYGYTHYPDRDWSNPVQIPPVPSNVLRQYTWKEQTEDVPDSWRKKGTGKYSNENGDQYARQSHGDIRLKHFARTGFLPLYMYSESPEFAQHVDLGLKRLEQQFQEGSGDVYYTQLGEIYAALHVAVNHAKQYKKLLGAAIEREDAVLNARATEAPDVPNITDTLDGQPLKFFPHQAQALAMLNNTDKGLLDADMGAGKALLSLADALVQLKQGRAQRVAVVMPGHVLAQQKAEYRRFTGNTVNVIPINTQVENYIGRAKLFKMIQSAPINTVVIVAYNWLARGKYRQESTGETYYPNADWLLKAGVDSVTLDESHAIRNGASNTSQACMQMAPHLKVKRCMTGTLIPNTPADVYMQATFLDPTILGTWEDFLDTYALEYTRRGKVSSWRDTAMKDLRRKLLSSGMLSIRRSNWLYLLPEIEKKFHRVDLTERQQKLYNNILADIIDEIKNDPHLGAALAAMEAATDDDDDGMEFGHLFAKFAPLDQFITNPKTHPLGADLPPAETIGPKVPKLDEIISSHFAMEDPGKVIVFSQYRNVAQHIVNTSAHADKMLYYDAGHKQNLVAFKTNPAVKILVAVDVSLREGHNLQVANRIIRVDMTWSPGPAEQSYARIYRLGQKRKVYLDIIACSGTAEMTKLARLISKRHTARKLISEFEDPTNLRVISMNVTNMMTFNKWDLLEPYVNREYEIDGHEKAEGEIAKAKQGDELRDLKDKKPVGGKAIDVPILAGEPPENHCDLHLLHFEDVWYLVIPEEGDTNKLRQFGWAYIPAFYEHKLDSKAAAKKVLQDIEAEGVVITNIKDVAKQVGASRLMMANTWVLAAAKAPRVAINFYTSDGSPALSADAQVEGHYINATLEKLGFSKVPASYWWGIGKTKSVPAMKKLLNALHGKARFDIDNWDEFVKAVHRAWGVDINAAYGYEPIAETLSEYTFEISGTTNRKELRECETDLIHSGAEVMNSFLDVKESKARITVQVPHPQQFLNAFQKTLTYPWVEEVHRQRAEELAESSV